jgi:hypothetical protein
MTKYQKPILLKLLHLLSSNASNTHIFGGMFVNRFIYDLGWLRQWMAKKWKGAGEIEATETRSIHGFGAVRGVAGKRVGRVGGMPVFSELVLNPPPRLLLHARLSNLAPNVFLHLGSEKVATRVTNQGAGVRVKASANNTNKDKARARLGELELENRRGNDRPC